MPNFLSKIQRRHQNRANSQTRESTPLTDKWLQARLRPPPPTAPHPSHRTAAGASGDPTLATRRGCFCSRPPCSRKPQGAPPVMETQTNSPVPILPGQPGSAQGWRRAEPAAGGGGCSLARWLPGSERPQVGGDAEEPALRGAANGPHRGRAGDPAHSCVRASARPPCGEGRAASAADRPVQGKIGRRASGL